MDRLVMKLGSSLKAEAIAARPAVPLTSPTKRVALPTPQSRSPSGATATPAVSRKAEVGRLSPKAAFAAVVAACCTYAR